ERIRESLLSFVRGRQARHHLVSSEYWAASRRSSVALDGFSAIIHDSCGVVLTASGFCTSAVLTSVTCPLTGQYSSETAFTDSIVPNTSPLLKLRPTSGNSR